MNTNAYTEKFVKIADGYGYMIVSIQEYFGKGLKVEVRPKDGDRYRYLPELREEREAWTIQTTSHGSLRREEIAEVVAGMQTAASFVSELESLKYDELTPYLHPELAARRAAK